MGKATKVQFEGSLVPAEEVEFEAVQEPWSTYNLGDGSTVKLKQVLVRVVRLTEKFKADGDPIYLLEGSAVTRVDAPPELKKLSGGIS